MDINFINSPLNPWKDIASYEFTELDRKLFKGRDADIKKFLQILSSGTFSVIYSSSGIGKSSFLKAGIEPRMRDEGFIPVHIIFHNTDNVESEIITSIEESLSKVGVEWLPTFTAWESLEPEHLNVINFEREKSLWWKLRTCIPTDKDGKQYRLLLVFDQFEEVLRKETNKLTQQRESLFDLLQSIYSLHVPEKAKVVLDAIYNKGFLLSLQPQNSYKVIFALRKEYLSDFDYWTNDRQSISDLLQNRMLLLPMSGEQAEEVITQQPLLDASGNIIEGCYTETLTDIKEQILNFIDKKQKKEIEPFLLSVLCSRLFDLSIQLGKDKLAETDLNNFDIKTVLQGFYEGLISRCKEVSIFKSDYDVNLLEEILVSETDGHRKRPSIRDEKRLKVFENKKIGDKTILQKLEEIHLLRCSSFDGDLYIEIIHDRIADIIFDRLKKRTKKAKLLFARISFIIAFVGLFFFTYYLQTLPTKDKAKAANFTYLEFLEGREKLNASELDNLTAKNLWNLQELVVDTDVVNIVNCPALEKVYVPHTYSNLKTIEISKCVNLRDILLDDSIKFLTLKIKGCPQVRPISLPKNLTSLNIEISPNSLSFITHNSHYIWKDSILWDTMSDSILYARYDASEMAIPPYVSEKKTYQCNLSLNINISRDVSKDSIKIEYSDTLNNRKTVSFARDIDTLDLTDYPIIKDFRLMIGDHEVTCSSFYRLRCLKMPNSLDSVPRFFCENCKTLEQVVLPYHYKTINSFAFYGCSKLSDINWPLSLSKIGSHAFDHCTALTEVKLPNEQISIGNEAFNYCLNLKYVRLPKEILPEPGITDEIIINPFFTLCPNISKFYFDNYSTYHQEKDGTIVYHGDSRYLLFTNTVKYHTYESDSLQVKFILDGLQACPIKFFSKKGDLYLGSYGHKDTLISLHNEKDSKLFVVLSNNIKNPYTYYWNNDTLCTKLYYPFHYFPSYFCMPLYPINTNKQKEIHIPFSTSKRLTSGLCSSIPDSLKRNLTLYVPYGTGRYFWDDDSFSYWKEIKEETFTNWIWLIIKHHFETGISVVNDWGIWRYIILMLIPFLLLLVFLSFYKNRKEKYPQGERREWLLYSTKSIFALSAGIFFWYVLYWFLFLHAGWWHLNIKENFKLLWTIIAVISVILSIMAVYVVFYSDGFTLKGLWDSIKIMWFNLRDGISVFNRKLLSFITWKRAIGGVLTIALLSYSISWYRDYTDYDTMVEKGNYSRALSILTKPIIATDTITIGQADSLHNLLIQSIRFPGVEIEKVWPYESYSDMSINLLCDNILVYKHKSDTCYHYIDFEQSKAGNLPYNHFSYSANSYTNSTNNKYIYSTINDTLYLWNSSKLDTEPIKKIKKVSIYSWLQDDRFVCISDKNDYIYKIIDTRTWSTVLELSDNVKDILGELWSYEKDDKQGFKISSIIVNNGKITTHSYKIKGTAIRHFDKIICAESNDSTYFYELKSGKLIGTESKFKRPEYSWDVRIGNNFITRKFGDSIYIHRIIDGNIEHDTINYNKYDYLNNEFIIMEHSHYSKEPDTIMLYHSPTGKIYNLGICKDHQYSRNWLSICDEKNIKLYYLGDTCKLIREEKYDYSYSVSTLDYNNNHYMTWGTNLFQFKDDSLWVVKDYSDIGKPTLSANKLVQVNGDYYSLDNLDAGRCFYIHNWGNSNITKSGWFFQLNNNEYRLTNIKSLQTLIRESIYINDKKKNQLIDIINKGEEHLRNPE